MCLLKELIKWLYDAFWPIWSLLIIYSSHQLFLLPCIDFALGVKVICLSEIELNKYFASFIQLVGGFIILYNIDSNLGLFKNTNIFSHSITTLKKFPLFKSMTSVSSGLSIRSGIEGATKARGYKSPESTKEHLEILQKQIDWLKEDFKTQKRESAEKVQLLENKVAKNSSDINNKVDTIEGKLVKSATEGFKPQVLGFILICYGAWLNVA
jgi:hypothetical protein